MPSADTSLASAIDKAEKEISKGVPPKVEEKEQPEVVHEEEGEGETSDTETGEGEDGEDKLTHSELSEDEQKESINLYKALKGPQANAIIAALAAQAGLIQSKSSEPLTKVESAEVKKDIQDILKDALGPEYAFLSDKLSKGIESVLRQERASSEARFAEITQSRVESEVVTAYEKLAIETKGESKKFENRMAALAEEVPIGNMSIRLYMQRLYTLASNETKSSPQKIADQIRRNASDAPARIRGGAAPESAEKKLPDKKMNLNESIAWAQKEIQKRK